MAELDLLNYPGSKLGSITSPAPSVLKPSTKQTPLGPQDKGQEYLAQIEPEMEELKKSTLAKSEIDTAQKQQLAESTARQKQSMSEASAAERQTIESSAPYKEEKTVQEQLKNAAFVPRQDNAQDLATLFSLINVLGFAIGSGGKGNAQQALAAMDGMAKGYQHGRVDLYKKEKDLFDTSMKTLKTKSDVLSKQVQEIVQLAARDKQAAAEKADAVFAQEGADFYREYAKRFGLAALAEYDKQRVTGLTKAFDLKTAQENKEREYIQKDKELALRVEQIASQERMRKAQIQASEEMKKMMFGFKQQDKVLPLSQGVRGVESLLTQLQDPEVKTGLIAKTAPIFEKFKSVVDDKEEFESAVNKAFPPQLTATDKTTLFLKNALLESYAIERAAAGGGRLTVQMMKQAGPVLDPTNYTPQTYQALLEERRRALYNNLGDMGYSPDKVKEMSQQRPYTPFAPTSTAQKPTLQDFLDKAKAVNPDATDNELTEFYNKKYGG
jgi:hypothetical protein